MMPRQPAKVAQRPAARCQIRQYILEDERTISGMFVQPLLIPEEVFLLSGRVAFLETSDAKGEIS